MEMYGNGVGTCMEVMQAERRLTQGEPSLAPTAWGAAAVGAAVGSTFVQRTGTSTTPATGAAISASGSSVPDDTREK